MKQDLIIDSSELARLLKVSPRTLRRMVAKEHLPRSVDYNRFLWVRSEIEEWIALGCHRRPWPNAANTGQKWPILAKRGQSPIIE